MILENLNITSLMLLILYLVIIIECYGASCNITTIATSKTGRSVEGKEDEFKVEVMNNCDCPQCHVTLKCIGFETVEPVDPNLFVKIGDTDACLVLAGQPIPPGSFVEFTYADSVPLESFGC